VTASITRTAAATITDARYVGAKVGADLRQLNSLYGRPDLCSIENFAEEIAILLNGGNLGTVDFGFYDPTLDAWRLRLRYRATIGGYLIDSRPGSLPRDADVGGLPFLSYLTYSAAFLSRTQADQDKIKKSLPVTRTPGSEPSASAGTSRSGGSYGRTGIGVDRDIYQAL
jgi:hypothetical protein